jgi:hypothetical protein
MNQLARDPLGGDLYEPGPETPTGFCKSAQGCSRFSGATLGVPKALVRGPGAQAVQSPPTMTQINRGIAPLLVGQFFCGSLLLATPPAKAE